MHAIKLYLTLPTVNKPNVIPSKEASPAGTDVKAGDIITYTIRLDNTTGTAPETVVVKDEEHEAVNEAEKRRMDPGCPVYDDEDRNKGEECNPGNACIAYGAGKGQRGDIGTKDQKKSFYDKI